MISEQNDIFLKFCRKILRIFDGVGIFKRLKSHDAEASGGETWYQNVRKEVNINMSLTKVLGAKRVKCDSFYWGKTRN